MKIKLKSALQLHAEAFGRDLYSLWLDKHYPLESGDLITTLRPMWIDEETVRLYEPLYNCGKLAETATLMVIAFDKNQGAWLLLHKNVVVNLRPYIRRYIKILTKYERR